MSKSESSDDTRVSYNVNSSVYVSVKAVTDLLSKEELASLVMWKVLGKDPRIFSKWEVVSSLFNTDYSDKPQMHDSIWEALSVIVDERIYGKQAPQGGKEV